MNNMNLAQLTFSVFFGHVQTSMLSYRGYSVASLAIEICKERITKALITQRQCKAVSLFFACNSHVSSYTIKATQILVFEVACSASGAGYNSD